MTAVRDKYLDTLGIPEYLYSNKDSKPSIKKTTKCLVVESNPVLSFCTPGDVQNFLFKMLLAINISSDEVELLNISSDNLSVVISNYDADTILIMSPDIESINNKCFITHHPSDILTQAELKRDAWEVLKQLELCLK